MNIKQTLSIITVILGCVVAHHSLANKDFVDSYYDSLKTGSLNLQTKTCEKIADYSGITEQRIFDIIETKLLALADHEKLSRDENKAAACFAMALASSGDARYADSLQKVSKSAKTRKIKKAAEAALPQIKKFKLWNSVINSDEFEVEGRSTSLALWMRFVDSDQADMGIYALEKVKAFATYDVNFMILLEEKLRAAIPQKTIADDKIDFYAKAMSYLMSYPEFGKYTSLVNEVAEQSRDKKLGKVARRALSN